MKTIQHARGQLPGEEGPSMNMKAWIPRFMLVALTLLLPTIGPAVAGPIGSVFNPRDYTPSLGDLVVTNGQALTIDTSGGTNVPTLVLNGATNTGVYALNQSGTAQVAVFSFNSIDIHGAAVVAVTGDRGLVLASRSDFSLNAGLSLAGSNGLTDRNLPGGIILAAREVNLQGCLIDIRGGDAPCSGGGGGGGGSGGRLAVYAKRFDNSGATINRNGGVGITANGAMGSYNVADIGHPEPWPFRGLGTVVWIK